MAEPEQFVLSPKEALVIVSLLETFVLEDKSMMDDPFYQVAEAVVHKFRARQRFLDVLAAAGGIAPTEGPTGKPGLGEAD